MFIHFSVSAMAGRPSIKALPGFDAGKDADALRKAMRGLGKIWISVS